MNLPIGVVMGVVVAGISFAFIGSLFNDSLIEIALTLVLSYVVFYLSENVFHASGVADLANFQYLAIIFIGVLIIRTVVIVALMPILARIGIGLTKEK
ncbi:hypothetical protein [Pseudoalteromonas sp. C2R02]|uniref:hypothetical protein n=1 Tax=Pseudoalteromonas sp. C2R02 TaxID=2841565 RepID=UPI00209117EE|nr:hypothetical protein [Pseudoalteromonas sp. C2R02]